MAISTTLVQVRERSFLDLVDLSLVVFRRRPLVFSAAAIAGVLPVGALDAWILWSTPDFPGFLMLLIVAWQIPFATAPLTIVLGGLMFGDRPSAWRVIKTLVKALPPMIVYQVLIRGILLLSFVLIPILPVRLAFMNEVILLERGRWRDVIKRNGVLCGENGGALLMRSLIAWVFGFLFVTSFRWGISGLAAILIGSNTWESEFTENVAEAFFVWLFDLKEPLAQAGIGIAVAFFGVVRFLTYIDLRIRIEGWEVELRLKSAGSALEESLQW